MRYMPLIGVPMDRKWEAEAKTKLFGYGDTELELKDVSLAFK